MTFDEALRFLEKHGVILESAQGPVPSLAAEVAGEPLRGSWWGHEKAQEIFPLTRQLRAAKDVLTCRLVNGKITYVHRRLWPALGLSNARRYTASLVTDLIRCDSEINCDLLDSMYASIPGSRFSIAPSLLDEQRRLWSEWDHLQPDRYLQHGASFRMRRFGYFELRPATGRLRPLSDAPYYQSRNTNRYAGGIHRRLAPLRDSAVTNRFLRELIRFDFSQFPIEGSKAACTWTLDVHMFRIIGRPDEEGEPTPEGIHHDGDEFDAVHLVQRRNAVGGVSGVYDNDQCLLESLTLRESMDSLIVWDPHVMHGVSPIRPKAPGQPAIRDVLIIGYNPDRRAAGPEAEVREPEPS